jgi:rhodanese-related sulfurtransferase
MADKTTARPRRRKKMHHMARGMATSCPEVDNEYRISEVRMKKLLLLTALLFPPFLWAGSDNPVIVDVRTQEEFKSGHIEGALHKPYDEIDAGISALLPDKSQHIILYCTKGGRAGKAQQALESLGYTHVENGGGYQDMQKRLAKTAAVKQAAAEENTIRSLEEQERAAVLKEDVDALEQLWSEQLIVNNPQNEISADRSVVIDRVKRGLIRYSLFERRIESIRFNEDLAIVMGSETVVRKDDTAVVQRRFTNIWKKSGPAWRMIARHANVVPHG